MFKKLLFVSIFAISIQIIIPSTQIIAQQSPDNGVLMSVAKDIWWLGSKMGQGCSGLYKLWCTHMTKNRLYAIVGIPWTAMAIHAGYKYYQIIDPIDKKYKTESIIINGREMVRFSNWKVDSYKTSADVNAHKAMINTTLNTDIKNSGTSRYGRYTLNDVEQAIAQEKEEIDQDLNTLANEFLVYCTFLPTVLFSKEYGLLKSYRDHQQAKDESQKIPANEVRWTKEQFDKVEKIMGQLCKNSWWHYLCKINFGTAAECWWKLKKAHLKLRALEEIVKHVKAGNSTPSHINQSVSVTEQDHAVSIHHDS